ncbi:lipopolysaccharide heptosyltransferase family protein [Aquimarina sp. AD10]|uniref:glycosyltransferase family 9 protein n=1 Tax=Aquimarina sp. AD10 TaxID=1714849 RepID=UPI000E491B40|nr:glycosyltransferase family 9 protein [Aquimarina sp. AD10]AXT63426.1 lipopolysaccharide heptosyltransferase family protein [Aquimarina sp. AD10]RKN00561.1 lipopolysaccharide heptosyltransferase family protein [Aquimarina sp. AD10]
MKILVIQQKMIGDVLTSTIICEALRKEYPNATIDYLVNSSTRPVLTENPFFDKIIEFKNQYRESKIDFYHFLVSIKKSKYDLVIDAYGKLESNLISLFSKAPKRVSFYKWYTQFIYTQVIHRASEPITNASIAIENRLRLVFPENRITSEIIKPKIFLTEDEKQIANEYLKSNHITQNKPLIMISVLGSSPNKTLPFKYMAKVIDEIVSTTGANVLFNYMPNQEKDARTIYNLTNYKTQKHIHFDVFAKSLRGFIAILSHCDALIGNEGGAVNMAKALNLPTFTIFSPWIIKKDWNMFEDGIENDSIHLIDIKPELYVGNSPKKMKDQSLELYQEFSSEYIIPKLRNYLTQTFT